MKKTIGTTIMAIAIAALISARPDDPPVAVQAASTDSSLAIASEIVATEICGEAKGIFCRGELIFATPAAIAQLPESVKIEFEQYRGGFVAPYDAIINAIWRDL